jgi:hypothetical protein
MEKYGAISVKNRKCHRLRNTIVMIGSDSVPALEVKECMETCAILSLAVHVEIMRSNKLQLVIMMDNFNRWQYSIIYNADRRYSTKPGTRIPYKSNGIKPTAYFTAVV